MRAVGEGGEPRGGVPIRLMMARKGEEGVSERKAVTDGKGEARFTGLDAKPTSGYIAEALVDGVAMGSKPFSLQENVGARVTLDVRPVSRDVSKLRIGEGSHFIFQVSDDAVEVIELWNLENPEASAIDPGPNGLHLPLPDRAVSAQSPPSNPPSVSVAGHEVVWRGPIAPGVTQVQVAFLLAYEGSSLDFVQRTPLPFASVGAVTEKIDGMSVQGSGLESEDREFQGRKLVLYRGPGTSAGGTIEMHLLGLPHNDPSWRYLASAVALALLVGFGVYAARGSGGGGVRERLEQQREHLLKELAALEQTDGGSDKKQRKKQELTARLVRIYRELDELR